jgi:hypothetical protein
MKKNQSNIATIVAAVVLIATSFPNARNETAVSNFASKERTVAFNKTG